MKTNGHKTTSMAKPMSPMGVPVGTLPVTAQLSHLTELLAALMEVVGVDVVNARLAERARARKEEKEKK